MKEIGSEFWEQYNPVCIENKSNEAYLLSGRTALRFIIDDICITRKVRKVMLPSYCCESMIQPFIQLGIEVMFYEVNSEKIKYSYDNDSDAILLIDFFGYKIAENSVIAKKEKEAGKIVIYDATHKLDGNNEVERYADYSFCSYRKWFYCNYAKAIKHNGIFNNQKLMSNNCYIKKRDEAAQKKKKYLVVNPSEKENFLAEFRAAEQILEEEYIGYAGVPVEFDLSEITAKRRENASYLVDELKEIEQIRLWRENILTDDTPMFVPILLKETVRNDLRKALINESIYCPVHWPKSKYHEDVNELYDMELSLVCDQRYSNADMERLIQVIKKFFNR